MSLILSIETSTKPCSVAIHDNGKLVANKILNIDRSHSEYLLLLIDQLFSIIPYDKSDLSAIAISKGPGSYTGLRVGLSTAKGLCFGLDIPLISINTLKIMIEGVSAYNITNYLLCPMIDARRNEVYCMLVDDGSKIIESINAKIIDEDSFEEILNKRKIIFFGDGSHKCKEIIKSPNAIFLNDIIPNSLFMGKLALDKFQKREFEDLDFVPTYLKSPV
ncbi:MAG: tRNA (adenosine(37)-N6)-threonylcarbamoyltransferase complex dimerization subunit type 1 TsaB [Bacteroidetes bacterium]|nr:tRNA (adenosine(37)-N6)-threonylcarbamoyltransferase complex dimerization subunit type 1 TsaB [Bacteroidota bacterium]